MDLLKYSVNYRTEVGILQHENIDYGMKFTYSNWLYNTFENLTTNISI